MTDDQLYKQRDGSEPFRFDASVASVFPDMLKRSIPGYSASIEAIGSLAARFVEAGTHCYDLGCSLGAASIAMRQGAADKRANIIAVDNSKAMIERCEAIIADETARDPESQSVIEVVLGDALQTEIRNASMVVLNYTLQFLSEDQRDSLIRRIYEGLNPNGLLLLSEKVVDENPAMETLLIDLHHEHKRRNHYSEMEISRKRSALENVLVPEKVSAHRARLEAAGFVDIAVWLRYFNFVSIIAIKR
ncbi:MAG: carboxy-S-adenosyl-L-methionine synthase CmoA [Woeseiaceae bacterium]|nr:carboxy-S-adenosyl-L-methionine synthase CmoA [Woeseiaceae bacterium]